MLFRAFILLTCLSLSGCVAVAGCAGMAVVLGTTGYLFRENSKNYGIAGKMKAMRAKFHAQTLLKNINKENLKILTLCNTVVIIGQASAYTLSTVQSILSCEFGTVIILARENIDGQWSSSKAIKIKGQLSRSAVKSVNYSVYVFGNYIFVIGVAESEEEKIRVLNILRSNERNKVLLHYIIVHSSNNNSEGLIVYESLD